MNSSIKRGDSAIHANSSHVGGECAHEDRSSWPGNAARHGRLVQAGRVSRRISRRSHESKSAAHHRCAHVATHAQIKHAELPWGEHALGRDSCASAPSLVCILGTTLASWRRLSWWSRAPWFHRLLGQRGEGARFVARAAAAHDILHAPPCPLPSLAVTLRQFTLAACRARRRMSRVRKLISGVGSMRMHVFKPQRAMLTQ